MEKRKQENQELKLFHLHITFFLFILLLSCFVYRQYNGIKRTRAVYAQYDMNEKKEIVFKVIMNN